MECAVTLPEKTEIKDMVYPGVPKEPVLWGTGYGMVISVVASVPEPICDGCNDG